MEKGLAQWTFGRNRIHITDFELIIYAFVAQPSAFTCLSVLFAVIGAWVKPNS